MIFDLKSIYSPTANYPTYPSLSWTSKSEVQLNFTVIPIHIHTPLHGREVQDGPWWWL